MDLRYWFLFLLTSIPSTLSKTGSPESTPRSAQPIVYTAETARQLDPPSPSQRSPTTTSADLPEDIGFVEPIDFDSFISAYEPKKSSALSPFTSESKPKEAFPDFFRNGQSTEKSYFDPGFGSLSSSASNQNDRKPQDDSEDGFVDPTVQFRSLFDSTETADGFRPQDFLNYKGESVSAEPSKGAQTRAYPSFTYSGRQDGEDFESSPAPAADNPRYRSSYRQVDSRERSRDPYDDRNYYGGERDDSPPPPRPPPRRYQVSGSGGNYNQGDRNEPPTYAPTGQETAHAPQASGKPKGAESSNQKGKCKKVEKVVDDEEEYGAYDDPNQGAYDPSTYDSRYKRQAGRGGRGGGGGGGQKKSNKKPMTCYVCEDEQGRYAERCSYDSNSDPNKGSYFHSSSTSFNDNGNKRGRNNGRERHRRNPSLTASASAVAVTTAPSESLPKRLEKRQSQGNRYASGYGDRDGDEGNYDSAEFEGQHRNGNGPSYGRSPNSNERNTNDYEGPPLFDGDRSQEPVRVLGNRNGPSGNDYGFSPPSSTGNRNEPSGNDYGFAPPSPRRPNQRGRGQNNEFDFGPPADFGRDPGQDSKGFDFDFSVPKEFERDINLGTSNTDNRPIFSGTNDNGPEGGGFDAGYEDYIKKYFPDAFGSTPGPGASSSHRPPSGVASSPERPYQGRPGPTYHHDKSSSPSYHPSRDHSSPDKEPTHPSHNYSPPPYFNSGPEESPEHLEKVISTFDQKDRRDCQKVIKGDMTCYVCRDPRGMNKEECMYKSNDPRNKQMSYHEVSEYSSLPPASILPLPRPQLAPAESKLVEVIKKSPLDYDFDY